MCAACGVPTHIPALDPEPEGDLTSAAQAIAGAPPARSVKFAALRNRSCRIVRSPLKQLGNEFIRRIKADLLHLLGWHRHLNGFLNPGQFFTAAGNGGDMIESSIEALCDIGNFVIHRIGH